MEKLINLQDYTLLEVTLFSMCCVFWFAVYMITIINIHKYQKIELPVVTVVANFSWELLWSWMYETNMGPLFQWGYRIWFFMDVYILYCAFKYGGNQFLNSSLKKNYKIVLACGLLTWMTVLYFMIPEFDKDQIGLFSAFVLNLYMSILYCFQIITQPDFSMSKLTGWFKMIGTTACSVMAFLHFWNEPGFQTLLAMCVLTFLFDCYYIWLDYSKKVFVEVELTSIHTTNNMDLIK